MVPSQYFFIPRIYSKYTFRTFLYSDSQNIYETFIQMFDKNNKRKESLHAEFEKHLTQNIRGEGSFQFSSFTLWNCNMAYRLIKKLMTLLKGDH